MLLYILRYPSIFLFRQFVSMHCNKIDIPDKSGAADAPDKQTGGLPLQAIAALLPLAGVLAFGQPALAVDAGAGPVDEPGHDIYFYTTEARSVGRALSAVGPNGSWPRCKLPATPIFVLGGPPSGP